MGLAHTRDHHFFARLDEGILNDVFTRKASIGWHPASPACVVVSLLLPQGQEVENWFLLARQKQNMWPLQMTTHTVGCSLPTERFMRRERRRLKAEHLWAGLAPQWNNLRARLWQKVTYLSTEHLYERFFLLKFGTQMETLRRCWHWQTISLILSMLTHHGNQVWHTKYGVYRRKEKADVRDEPTSVELWP